MNKSRNIEFKEGRIAECNPPREAAERKEDDDALLECAAGFASFFERNADAMSFFDPKTLRHIEVNEAAVRAHPLETDGGRR